MFMCGTVTLSRRIFLGFFNASCKLCVLFLIHILLPVFRPVSASAKLYIDPYAETELKTPKVDWSMEVQSIAVELIKPQVKGLAVWGSHWRAHSIAFNCPLQLSGGSWEHAFVGIQTAFPQISFHHLWLSVDLSEVIQESLWPEPGTASLCVSNHVCFCVFVSVPQYDRFSGVCGLHGAKRPLPKVQTGFTAA